MVQSGKSAVLLNREILSAAGALDILETCRAHLDEFDAVNFATAIHRIAKTKLSDNTL